MALDARAAARVTAGLSGPARDAALGEVRAALVAARGTIEKANRADKEAAKTDKLDAPLLKRLDLEGAKFDGMLAKLDEVRALDDPLDNVSYACELDAGLELYRCACPIGVICVIFESRPEAAVQIAALALKSANALILKGGREAARTNRALTDAIRAGLVAAAVPSAAVQLVETRAEVGILLSLHDCIDLIIPRGSNALVSSIMANTRIPVMGHADGICSLFLDATADPAVAVPVVVDAKTDYPVACNALETLLVHTAVLSTVWPQVAAALIAAGVELRADGACMRALAASELTRTSLSTSTFDVSSAGASVNAVVSAATAADYRCEFGALTLAVKAVGSVDEAIEHINGHGSHHTDGIISQEERSIEAFLSLVDSAGVYANASTRFADGQRYGFGAEVGVSTNRIHSRGPMGVEGLLIYKYRLYGAGHVASNYGPAGHQRRFTHRRLPNAMPTHGGQSQRAADAGSGGGRWLLLAATVAAAAAVGFGIGCRVGSKR